MRARVAETTKTPNAHKQVCEQQHAALLRRAAAVELAEGSLLQQVAARRRLGQRLAVAETPHHFHRGLHLLGPLHLLIAVLRRSPHLLSGDD